MTKVVAVWHASSILQQKFFDIFKNNYKSKIALEKIDYLTFLSAALEVPEPLKRAISLKFLQWFYSKNCVEILKFELFTFVCLFINICAGKWRTRDFQNQCQRATAISLYFTFYHWPYGTVEVGHDPDREQRNFFDPVW